MRATDRSTGQPIVNNNCLLCAVAARAPPLCVPLPRVSRVSRVSERRLRGKKKKWFLGSWVTWFLIFFFFCFSRARKDPRGNLLWYLAIWETLLYTQFLRRSNPRLWRYFHHLRIIVSSANFLFHVCPKKLNLHPFVLINMRSVSPSRSVPSFCPRLRLCLLSCLSCLSIFLDVVLFLLVPGLSYSFASVSIDRYVNNAHVTWGDNLWIDPGWSP